MFVPKMKTLFVLVLVLAIGINEFTTAQDVTEEQDDYDLDENEEAIVPEENDGEMIGQVDPCLELKCGAGRECRINEETGEGKCSCVLDCGLEVDPRRRVCTNHNETFPTDCEVYRTQCLCEENDDSCEKPELYKHMHIEYYGECRDIPACSADELSDFPRRMREWLFNVMSELSERKELSYYYQKMEKEAEKDMKIRWRNAAIWKWCDLDGQPSDSAVSRHELFPVKAPLQSLEHCIGDFLDGCDLDDDHMISLTEWGTCLEIPAEEMRDECEKINQD